MMAFWCISKIHIMFFMIKVALHHLVAMVFKITLSAWMNDIIWYSIILPLSTFNTQNTVLANWFQPSGTCDKPALNSHHIWIVSNVHLVDGVHHQRSIVVDYCLNWSDCLHCNEKKRELWKTDEKAQHWGKFGRGMGIKFMNL